MKIFISQSVRYDPAWNHLTYEQAQVETKKRFAERDAAEAALYDFTSKHARGTTGLLSDEVKATPEFKKLYHAYHAANERCNFNLWFRTRFKKELAADVKAKRGYGYDTLPRHLKG